MKSNREMGIGKLTILVFGSLLAALVFSCYQILPFYYYYYELENQIYSVSRLGQEFTDQEIRDRIIQKMKELEIPATGEALVLNRYENNIRVVLDYTEQFYVTYKGKDHIIHSFPFSIDMTTEY